MAMPMMDAKETAAQKKQRDEWEAEDDLRTLRRADEIRKDPARLKRAQAMVGKFESALGEE